MDLTGDSINAVLIGSISAVIIVCIVATVTLAAVVLYRKGEHQCVYTSFKLLHLLVNNNLLIITPFMQVLQEYCNN